MAQWYRVASVGDVGEGAAIAVKAGFAQIALYKSSGQFYAIDGVCAHKGGPMGEGFVQDGCATCPWHGWQYDLQTGACATTPGVKLKSYAVKVEGNEVFVEV
ncbi:Rieske 2Fe-2S domain-containing protein [Candidatus Micrarchaeota archaeon]|nr:Rieske 2Fe-2S domain-containing protein [Candidatus Micrarchaeota archaeon]MBI5176832.1 Rieske 2Fe-2S domain-containing protein [Candidatus Micrarchaeota archaeon]